MSGLHLVETGYVPRPLQKELHVASGKYRFLVLNLHRRFGKTVFAVNDMMDHLIFSPLRQPQGVYVAPTYGQAKRVAWDIFKQYYSKFPGVEFKEGELLVIIPRPHMNDVVKVWLLGAENPHSIRGMYLDYAVLDEYASMTPLTWEQVIRPALSDRKGRATFIGTPAGMNHFYKIYIAAQELGPLNSWYCRTINVEESGYVDADELLSARKTMPEDKYNQEFMCSFTAALVGAYFSKYLEVAENEGRICEVPHTPSLPVATFWDLGIDDAMAIWFIQRVGEFYNIIDYYEESGKGIEHYYKVLQLKNYVYSRHHMPHDVSVRELSTGQSRLISFEKLGLRPIERIPKCKVKADMITASRMAIPLCKFDRLKTAQGLNCLRNYQADWNDKLQIFKDTPRHDWSSNGADAFGTFAMGKSNYSFDPAFSLLDDLPSMADMEYNEFTA